MGKKSRLVSGRRPILRLSPPGPRSGVGGLTAREDADSASEDEQEVVGDLPKVAQSTPSLTSTVAKPAVVKPTGGLCLLGAYADSDDDEDNETPEKSTQVVNTNGNPTGDIDSTLANFLAEIDAITAPAPPGVSTVASTAPPPTPPRPEPKDTFSGLPAATQNGAEPAQEAAWQYDTQCSLAGVGVEMGDWQEVWDENTGCFYYWNIQTNEVTWELPHYLAAQIQGMQDYRQSSVTSNTEESYMVSTDLYSQEKTEAAAAASIATSRPAQTKKEIKKEVNEAVQALSNSEEEKKGVAASLLAPLLPKGVKEEEERWRRKVICKGAEVGQEAVEAETASEEPEVAIRGLEDLSQDDVCSVVQSGESEEEEEQDTHELEMVLERRKAELRALEEGDGSSAGSSPRSDVSQSASQDGLQKSTSKRGKWKVVRAASPELNSRSSSKNEQETPKNGETVSAPAPAPAEGAVKEMQTETLQETMKVQPKLEEDDEQDLKFQIGELANTLTSKLEFLGISRQSLSNFHVLLLQTETRISDWREGALNGSYLKRKLQDAAEQIKQYEINATPKGWSCHWDRDHRRYFYVNEQTGESQWEFPDGEEEEEEGQAQENNKAEAASKLAVKEKVEETSTPLPKPSENPTVPVCKEPFSVQPPAAPVVQMNPFWGLLQPPLPMDLPMPPPPPPPPESPPPPPPPPGDDGDIQEVDMEDEEEDGEEPPAPGTEDDSFLKRLCPMILNNKNNLDSAVSSPTGAKATKRKAEEISVGQTQQAATIGSCPVLYSQATVSTGSQIASVNLQANYLGLSVSSATPVFMSTLDYTVPSSSTVTPVQPALPRRSLPVTSVPEAQPPPRPPPPPKPQPAEKPKRVKKDKAKKNKTKMPSLVQKWQSIQRELDEDENSSSSEEDRDSQSQKRIDDWKLQQLSSGMAEKNANFEALPEDWRDRLKRRKMASNT
ncbi:formin-binding protein 4 [Rhinatrema bivittatum]|uniref:formin-binding protein 4 n=1 Tax=Rhinatrema bivittatum TaxID=194408 RepID=UPI001126D9AB|nr:formin-binding protein 4 [Rhinatrema bivittatum]